MLPALVNGYVLIITRDYIAKQWNGLQLIHPLRIRFANNKLLSRSIAL